MLGSHPSSKQETAIPVVEHGWDRECEAGPKDKAAGEGSHAHVQVFGLEAVGALRTEDIGLHLRWITPASPAWPTLAAGRAGGRLQECPGWHGLGLW